MLQTTFPLTVCDGKRLRPWLCEGEGTVQNLTCGTSCCVSCVSRASQVDAEILSLFLALAAFLQIAALHSKAEDEYFTMSSDDGETAQPSRRRSRSEMFSSDG